MTLDEIVQEIKRLSDGLGKGGEDSFQLALADGKELAILSKGLTIEVEVGQRFPNSQVIGWYNLTDWKTADQLKADAEEAIATKKRQAVKDGKPFEEDTSPEPIVPEESAPVAIRLTFRQD